MENGEREGMHLSFPRLQNNFCQFPAPKAEICSSPQFGQPESVLWYWKLILPSVQVFAWPGTCHWKISWIKTCSGKKVVKNSKAGESGRGKWKDCFSLHFCSCDPFRGSVYFWWYYILAVPFSKVTQYWRLKLDNMLIYWLLICFVILTHLAISWLSLKLDINRNQLL